MRFFASTCELVASVSKKKEKVRLVAELLRSRPMEDAAVAAVFLTGRPFARTDSSVLGVGGSLIWAAVARVADAQGDRLEDVYRKYGDLGAMAEELLDGRQPSEPISIVEVQRILKELSKRRGPTLKAQLLDELLRRTTPLEAKYIVKVVTGELRIGLKESLVEEAIAMAFDQPLSKVQRASMLLGDIGSVLRLAAERRLGEVPVRLFQPLGFMLANSSETPGEAMSYFPQGALVEDKWDGIRAQVHKSETTVRLFSRTLEEVTEFPELNATFKNLPGDFILDGEIVGWRDGRPLAFTEFQQRLGRKQRDLFLESDIPVKFVAFDMLYQDGRTLLDDPLRERRRRLNSLLTEGTEGPVKLSPMVLCDSPEAVGRAFSDALKRGNEGVMTKAPDSPYRPGRRGRFWIKLKKPLATLDVVVTAVEFGHGKRHDVLSDYTFSVRDGDGLVTIGKAYTGLTDHEIAELTKLFLKETVEARGSLRRVRPNIVLEVAFNNIQRSNRHESGYALRFPRIVRQRPDKPVAEIDTLDRVREIYETSQLGPQGN
jgi:DNA ligase-1